jgi:hypothetical protein
MICIDDIVIDGKSVMLTIMDPKEAILTALFHANSQVEFEKDEVEFEILFKRTREGEKDGYISLSIVVDKVMEVNELLSKHNIKVLEEDIRNWVIENIRPHEIEPEAPRPEGMSWVHGVFQDKSSKKVIGRFTACVNVSKDYGDALDISFAFCMPNNRFSKRTGRIISRARIDEGRVFTIDKGSDRYSSVMAIVNAAMRGKPPMSLIVDNWGDTYPGWLVSHRKMRKDIPDDVSWILKEFLKVDNMPKSLKEQTEIALWRREQPDTKIWQIRD